MIQGLPGLTAGFRTLNESQVPPGSKTGLLDTRVKFQYVLEVASPIRSVPPSDPIKYIWYWPPYWTTHGVPTVRPSQFG